MSRLTQFLYENFNAILTVISILVVIGYLLLIYPKLKAEETRTSAIGGFTIFILIYILIYGLVKYAYKNIDHIINNFELDIKFILCYILIPLVLIQLIIRLKKNK
jgi:uncharacterized membrane protein